MNGSRFGCNFWTSTVRNLTCQVWILTEATLRLYAVGKKSAIREGKTQDDQCPLSYRQERASSRHVRSKSGEHHDTHNIVAVMQNMMEDMAKANIRTDGLFLNADAGFDCAPSARAQKLWNCVKHLYQQKKWNDKRQIVLDELLYRERYSIERTNAWMDSFRTILNRFDTTLRNWESWNYIAFSVMLLRKCARKKKSLNHFII